MDVNVNVVQVTNNIYTSTPVQSVSVETNVLIADTANPAAEYDKSNDGAYPVDKEAVKKMLDDMKRQQESFMQMIYKLMLKQANSMGIADKHMSITFDLMSRLAEVADQETIDWAKEAVSEDGYYGVKQTSERIFNFAKAITGGDPSKIGLMRDSIQKGYDMAERMWGDKLPEICKQTFDRVMEMLDEWENGGKVPDNTVVA